MNQARIWLTVGALGGLLSVSLGAFGAHGLKGHVALDLLVNWNTAADYLGFHALAIISCALVMLHHPSYSLVAAAAWSFLVGSLLFSGSLFLMTLSGERMLGMVTPVGGLALIAGWTLLALGAWRMTSAPH